MALVMKRMDNTFMSKFDFLLGTKIETVVGEHFFSISSTVYESLLKPKLLEVFF